MTNHTAKNGGMQDSLHTAPEETPPQDTTQYRVTGVYTFPKKSAPRQWHNKTWIRGHFFEITITSYTGLDVHQSAKRQVAQQHDTLMSRVEILSVTRLDAQRGESEAG